MWPEKISIKIILIIIIQSFQHTLIKACHHILTTTLHLVYDSVQDSYEEQEFWMTRLDWVGIRLNQFEMLKNIKTVYQDEKNVVLVENSVKWKPCINRESKSLEITI